MGQISFINWQALCLDYRSIALDYFDSALSDIGE